MCGRVKAAQAGGIAGILEGQQDAENSEGEMVDGRQQREQG